MKQEGRNKAECLRACPERTVEPALWSLLPSGLCLAFGKKIPPLNTSFFLEGRLILLTSRHLKVIGIFLVAGGGGRSRPGALQGQSCALPLLLLPGRRGMEHTRILHHPRLLGGCWRCPYPHSPIMEPTPGECSFFQGETEARGRGTGIMDCKHPPVLPWLVYWWIRNVWLALHLEKPGKGTLTPKNPFKHPRERFPPSHVLPTPPSFAEHCSPTGTAAGALVFP